MRTTGRTPTRLGLCLAVALLAACAGAEDAPDGATPTPPATTTEAPQTADPPASAPSDREAEDVTIVVSDFAYEVPDSVPPGAEVTVTNEDAVGHTVTSDEEGVFDVAVGPGETVTFTAPAEAGEYGFFCIPHPDMTATLVVG